MFLLSVLVPSASIGISEAARLLGHLNGKRSSHFIMFDSVGQGSQTRGLRAACGPPVHFMRLLN
jgi:hypothetical protein